MSHLILPSGVAPTSLHLRPGTTATFVDGDLYDIGRRLQEMHPSVYAVQLDDGHGATWAIMENCEDGVQRLIFKTDALDGRVLDKLGRIMSVPLHQRIAQAEAEEYRLEQQRKDDALEKLYYDVGEPMLRELDRCGFIQRPTSYAKRGITFKRS